MREPGTTTIGSEEFARLAAPLVAVIPAFLAPRKTQVAAPVRAPEVAKTVS